MFRLGHTQSKSRPLQRAPSFDADLPGDSIASRIVLEDVDNDDVGDADTAMQGAVISLLFLRHIPSGMAVMSLYDETCSVVATTATDDSGEYGCCDILIGTYASKQIHRRGKGEVL